MCATPGTTTSFAPACPYKNQMTIEPVVLTPTYVSMTGKPTYTLGTSAPGDVISCDNKHNKRFDVGSMVMPVLCEWVPKLRTKVSSAASADKSIAKELSMMDNGLEAVELALLGYEVHKDYKGLMGKLSAWRAQKSSDRLELSSLAKVLSSKGNHGSLSAEVGMVSSKLASLDKKEQELLNELSSGSALKPHFTAPTTKPASCLSGCNYPKDKNVGSCKLHHSPSNTWCECTPLPKTNVPVHTVCGQLVCPNDDHFCPTMTGECAPPYSSSIGWCLRSTTWSLVKGSTVFISFCDCVHGGTMPIKTKACGVTICPNQIAEVDNTPMGHTFWGWGYTSIPSHDPVQFTSTTIPSYSQAHFSLAATGHNAVKARRLVSRQPEGWQTEYTAALPGSTPDHPPMPTAQGG